MRFQVRITVVSFVALLLYLVPGSVAAGGRLPALAYRGGGQGKVVFDHQRHRSKGLLCNDCHTDYSGTGKQLFSTRKQGLITLADHKTGTTCCACHDGKNAFDACGRCHYKIGSF
jgi:phosphate transport system substrate-binding protein